MEEGLGLVSPGGGLVGAAVFLGAFHSSWDREACAWEAGPEGHVDFMSDSLPGRTAGRHVRGQRDPQRAQRRRLREERRRGTPTPPCTAPARPLDAVPLTSV